MTATQSSTYGNETTQFGAGNCIDGVTGPMDSNGHLRICHTNFNTTAPWIAIDFGASNHPTTVTVQRVELFHRQGYGKRTRNVDVRITNELPTSDSKKFSGGTLLGHFAGPATDDGQHIIISGQAQL